MRNETSYLAREDKQTVRGGSGQDACSCDVWRPEVIPAPDDRYSPPPPDWQSTRTKSDWLPHWATGQATGQATSQQTMEWWLEQATSGWARMMRMRTETRQSTGRVPRLLWRPALWLTSLRPVGSALPTGWDRRVRSGSTGASSLPPPPAPPLPPPSLVLPPQG